MKRELSEDEEPVASNLSTLLWQVLLDRVSIGPKGLLKAQLVAFESLPLQQQRDCLQSIVEATPYLSTNEQYAISEAMIAKLETVIDPDIKVMIIILLEVYARMPHVDASRLLTALIHQLTNESSRVRCHLYMCISTIVEARLSRNSTELKDVASEISRRIDIEMTDTDHQLRATCLKLIALLPFLTLGKRLALSTKAKEAQQLLVDYAYDKDYRVRKSALDSLDSLRLRGCPLNSALYQLVSVSLKDDYEQVRLSGLNLIGAISRQSPEMPMRLKSNEKESMRLIDVAFIDICDLVNDISLAVRTKACVVLASYQEVDLHVLQQTFSKQLMSHLRRKVKKLQPTKELIPVAEGDVDAGSEEIRILDSGACGAFIHGLEDEFEEVRSASIDSICELCEYNDQLVKQAVAYLVDMFNDEIEKVRVNAIQSLRKIGSLWPLELNAELLEIALGALDDSDPVTRHAMHGLLKVVRLSEMTLLTVLLDALVANIKRNPEDLLSVYECLSEVGKKHEDYVELYIPTLLKLDKRYLPKEANVEDVAYAGNAILIINACLTDPSILSKVPKFMFAHFTYFKSKYPTCVPDLEDLYKNAPIKLDKSIYSERMNIDDYKYSNTLLTHHEDTSVIFELIRARIARKDFSAAAQAIAVAKRNFAHLETANPKSLGNARLAVLYLEVYEEIIKVKQNLATASMAHMASEVAAKLMRLSYSMQYTFYGCSATQLETAAFLRTVANVVLLFGLLKRSGNTKESQRYLQNALSAAHRRITTFKIDANTPSDIALAISNLRDVVSDTNSGKSMIKLHTFIAGLSLPALNFDNHVKCTTAVITEPLPNPDKPFKFIGQAPVLLKIIADIKNAFDYSGIAVEISLPDNSTQLWWPSTYEFTPTSPGCYSLKTQVSLEFPKWTEPSSVGIRLVRSFEPDIPFLDTSIMKYPNQNKATRNAQIVATVPISEDVGYTLFPTTRV